MARILEIWPLLLGMLAGVFLYFKGQLDGKSKAERKRQQEAKDTHERINNAPITNSLSEARAWLATHARRLRGKR